MGRRMAYQSAVKLQDILPQPLSIFFMLPLEIRFMIYVILMVSGYPVTILATVTGYPKKDVCRGVTHHRQSNNLSGQVLRTCKQIYLESLKVLYNKNEFTFPDEVPRYPYYFFSNIGTDARDFLQTLDLGKSVTSKSPSAFISGVFLLMAKCRNLKVVKIDLLSTCYYYDYISRRRSIHKYNPIFLPEDPNIEPTAYILHPASYLRGLKEIHVRGTSRQPCTPSKAKFYEDYERKLREIVTQPRQVEHESAE